MHLMLTNKGPTPMPFGTGEANGFEGLLPPGLEIPFARDDVTTLVFGEQPEAAGRSKYNALREVDPASPLAVEYATDIDQWKGRSDVTAESAVMRLNLFIRNVGRTDVTVTTTDGPLVIAGGEGVEIWTVAGSVTQGEAGPGPTPDPQVEISGFSAEFDSLASSADTSALDAGDTVTLTSTAGEPAARAIVDGHSGAIFDLTPTGFRVLGLNLMGQDVTGLAATATFTSPVDNTGTITAFTAANPTEVTMDAEDEGLLAVGALVTLEALTGDPAAMAAINGATATVQTKAPVTLNIDLSAVDVTALTADFTVS